MDVHAGMTALKRRQILPFIWVSLCGMQPQVTPDNDQLLHATLSLNRLQISWRCLNQSFRNAKLSAEAVSEIQKGALDACVKLLKILGTRINTKLHIIIYHCANHIESLRCRCRGNMDSTETMHKETVVAY